uniref:Uncharacterized protein n=1 Tax=Stegastes partitus TaxID=144197 RepID=A0A3B5AZ09_9TELE
MPRSHTGDDSGGTGLWLKTSTGRRAQDYPLKDVESGRRTMNNAVRVGDGLLSPAAAGAVGAERKQGARLSLLGKPLTYSAQSGLLPLLSSCYVTSVQLNHSLATLES